MQAQPNDDRFLNWQDYPEFSQYLMIKGAILPPRQVFF